MSNDMERFLDACQEGKLEKVKNIYDCNNLPINFIKRCFMRACKGGHLQVAKYLSEQSSNLYGEYCLCEGYCGLQAFRDACLNGYLPVVKYLAEKYSDSNDEYKEYAYQDVLKYACQSGYLDVVKYLLEHGTIITENYFQVACY